MEVEVEFVCEKCGHKQKEIVVIEGIQVSFGKRPLRIGLKKPKP